MHIFAIDDRFLHPLAFVFSRISFLESLGCILPSNVCGKLSELSLPCYFSSVAQQKVFEGLYWQVNSWIRIVLYSNITELFLLAFSGHP
jgi:hypothetical protein